LVLGFTVLVIAGGSVVRATGSGAGCGDTWPVCDGRLFPVDPAIETGIEFTHRLMSGLAILGVACLALWALAVFSRGHPVRRTAALALVFLILEALIGAVLVLYGWVDTDASLGRLVVVPLHLVNTFLLLGALALTAWWGSGRPLPAGERGSSIPIAVGLGALLAVGASGALNALADTLFPASSVAEGVRAEFGEAAPVLLRLRVIHPLIAIGLGLLVAWIASRLVIGRAGTASRLARLVLGLVLLQMVVGLVNVVLLTPLEVQVIHLLIADLLWITFVLLGAAVAAGERTPVANGEAVA